MKALCLWKHASGDIAFRVEPGEGEEVADTSCIAAVNANRFFLWTFLNVNSDSWDAD